MTRARMAALSMIPLVDPAFVWVPAGAALIATGAPCEASFCSRSARS